MAATIMIQGTGSDVGKSLLVAGLCRIFYRHGIKVAPFKPQNMALNSAVTPCGGEVGRAQAVQAIAANVPLQVHFNPVLLKPNSDTGAQVIIQGRALSDMEAASYQDYKKSAMAYVLDSHQKLLQQFEAIVVEGAGSPAEINLREGDIANMGFAEAVDCPVILAADIDKGGVFAQLVGTLELISDSERARIKGFIINKFRGDVKLLQPGLEWLEQRTGKPVLGVLPYLQGLEIAAEDAIAPQQQLEQALIKIVVPVFSRISNHTDFDPLRLHPQIDLTFIGPGDRLPPADLIILPGSKNVRLDLAMLKNQQWDQDIFRHLRYGGKVLGICGGYQMLGEVIDDPEGVEQQPGSSKGLSLLPIHTTITQQKQLSHTAGQLSLAGQSCIIHGYEIHAGRSQLLAQCQPLMTMADQQTDGCINADDNVAGCYLHGLFDTSEAITVLGHWLGVDLAASIDYQQQQQDAINHLADAMEAHLDIATIKSFLRE